MSKNRKTFLLGVVGVASNVFYIVLERMGTSIIYTILLAVVSASLYGWAIWEWSGQFRYDSATTRRSRGNNKQETIMRMALTMLFLTVFGSFIAYQQLGLQSPSNETLNTLERYRRALGLEKGSGTTTLIELSNKELKQKGTLLYKKIREVNSFHEKRLDELQNKNDSNGISEEVRRVEEEYNNEIATDAKMVLDELKNRIPYERRKNMMGLPEINPADPKSGSPSMYRAPWASPFNLLFSQMMANDIEELVKLLPDRGAR